MSNTKFTPGPWRYWETVNGFRVAGHPKNPEAASCWVADVTYPEREASSEANARLISSAPDLYDALCDMVSDHESISPGTLSFAKRALAKARGE